MDFMEMARTADLIVNISVHTKSGFTGAHLFLDGYAKICLTNLKLADIVNKLL